MAITNSNGTSYSDISTLNLVPPPIIPQPSHQIAVVGQIVSFEVNAIAGSGFSWQKTDSNGSWVALANANSHRIEYGPVKLDENGTLFRVTISGGSTPITSQSARLTVRLQENLAEFQHGLKAFYPFNGNANDESGNDNNGTVTNVVFVNRGADDNNTMAQFGSSSSITASGQKLPQGNTPRTMSCLVKITGAEAGTESYIVGWGNPVNLTGPSHSLVIVLTAPQAQMDSLRGHNGDKTYHLLKPMQQSRGNGTI